MHIEVDSLDASIENQDERVIDIQKVKQQFVPFIPMLSAILTSSMGIFGGWISNLLKKFQEPVVNDHVYRIKFDVSGISTQMFVRFKKESQ